jgi:RNA polymerase sigma-70 factor (ECF subfamily)
MSQGQAVPPTGPDADARLAARLGRAEPEAEAELVARFRPGLVALFRVRTRDPEAAEELANDTLMAVFGAVRAGKLRENERLAGYVHGVARNLLNNFYRRRSSLPPSEPIEDHAARLPAADDAPGRERRAVVERAVAELEPVDRQVLSFILGEGLTAAEIALRLGVSPEAVRMRKSRALRRVTERIREWLRK